MWYEKIFRKYLVSSFFFFPPPWTKDKHPCQVTRVVSLYDIMHLINPFRHVLMLDWVPSLFTTTHSRQRVFKTLVEVKCTSSVAHWRPVSLNLLNQMKDTAIFNANLEWHRKRCVNQCILELGMRSNWFWNQFTFYSRNQRFGTRRM